MTVKVALVGGQELAGLKHQGIIHKKKVALRNVVSKGVNWALFECSSKMSKFYPFKKGTRLGSSNVPSTY